MILRVTVTDDGGAALPPVDVDGDFVIGAGEGARIRLPAAEVASDVHVRQDDVGAGRTYEIGRYRVRVEPAPAGAVPAPPQRTESLARELVRGLLGAGASPTLEVERGPVAGAKRALAPPESVLVIGRGDEAGWIIDDQDLSRAHAEIRRGWDGVRVVDLASKNGTRIDGASVGQGAELRDGALVELGNTTMRFRDPAERYLRGDPPAAAAAPAAPVPVGARPLPAVFYVAATICVLALAGLVWVVLA